MSAKILNGRELAKQWRAEIASTIQQRSAQGLRAPGVAVILVGDNYASQVYVRNKKVACKEVGIKTFDYALSSTASQSELLELINNLNHDPEIDGILVQLPLPAHMEPAAIFESVNPDKDIDGFHPYNLGRLAQGRPYIRPATPAGIMRLLKHTKENLVGKTATVIGTSNIVGRPMLLELLAAGVTISACNLKTRDLIPYVENSDILIVATGNIELIKGAWIKPGSIVIDVGINRNADGNIIGDVEFKAAQERAGWITPVPGGVGPMTIASLLHNCVLTYINGT